MRATALPVDRTQATDRRRHRVLIVDEIAVDAIADKLGAEPSGKAMTGVPQAMATVMTMPKGSAQRIGMTRPPMAIRGVRPRAWSVRRDMSIDPQPSTTPTPEPTPGSVVSLTETIVLKEADLFLVSLRDGTVPLMGHHPLGLYLDDCRYLSGHELRIAGVAPRLLVASAAGGQEAIHELTNPDVGLSDGTMLALQTLQVRLERRLLGPAHVQERLHLRLYGREPVTVDAELTLAADFRPMLALRKIVDLPAPRVTVTPRKDGLRFDATTSDGVRHATVVQCDPPPAEVRHGHLRFSVELTPGGHGDIVLDYRLRCVDRAGRASRATRPRPRMPAVARTQLRADDELFKRVVARSLVDLRTLRSPMDGESYFAAGVPWFATLFGRDSLITAIEMLGFVPEVGAQTLRVLARRLGRTVDPYHEEEPGKVVHELRVGEAAAVGRTPLSRYYGTVDATPLFLCLVAEHADWSGSLAVLEELREPVQAALEWVLHRGDHNGDGLLDYRASTPQGLRNQGWKDSDEAIMDQHGVPLEPPIAVIEAQAYAIRGLRAMARLLTLEGDDHLVPDLERRAGELERGLERFWLPQRRCYGMAIDGQGRTSSALGSNQGHLLWAEVVAPDRARAIRDALMSEQMFSGWGLRTLGCDEAAYNPVGYHLGTVWPHDTAMIAAGLRNYGFDEDFTMLFEALLEAASHAEGYSLPELFAGFSRAEYETPVPYPVACHPQAWASGAIPSMLIQGLGLKPDGLNGRLRVRRPSLPRWVNRVEIEDLAIAGGRVDLRFERTSAGDSVALTDARIEGDVEVVLEISPAR